MESGWKTVHLCLHIKVHYASMHLWVSVWHCSKCWRVHPEFADDKPNVNETHDSDWM